MSSAIFLVRKKVYGVKSIWKGEQWIIKFGTLSLVGGKEIW